jgi:hypothetical protein
MALAAFADAADADADIAGVVDEVLTAPPTTKGHFKDSPLYNVGVEAPECSGRHRLLGGVRHGRALRPAA